MDDFNRDEQKALIKEAIHEWLDEKYATFGKWTLKGLTSAALAIFIYLYAAAHGWVVPKL